MPRQRWFHLDPVSRAHVIRAPVGDLQFTLAQRLKLFVKRLLAAPQDQRHYILVVSWNRIPDLSLKLLADLS